MTDLFDYARRRRDRGMSIAADAEDDEQPEFAVVAYSAIRVVAERQDTVHVDDVLPLCTVKPNHPNAFGAVWMRAIRDRIIAHSGMVRPCRTDAKKNAHRYPVYRSLISTRGV
jgi:hypothetical protein